jgi:flagellar hook-associated protein 3 FlgL
MRITNAMLQQSALRQLQVNLERISRAQAEVSSGKKLSKPSDDPVAVAQVMRGAHGLRALEQYRRGVNAARARLDAEEAVLNQVTTLTERARELAVGEGSDTATAATRLAAKAEVDRILEQLVQLGNTAVGDERIFGGGQTTAPPFQPGGAYVGDDTARVVETGPGQTAGTSHTGRELLVDSGIISGITALRDALAAGTQPAVAATTSGLGDAFDKVQALLADVGARVVGLDVTDENIAALDASLTLRTGELEGADFEAAATRLVGAQTALQAALLSTSRVLGTSLVEYLR